MRESKLINHGSVWGLSNSKKEQTKLSFLFNCSVQDVLNGFPNIQMSLNSQDGRRRLIDPTILATCSQESLSTILSLMNRCISPEMSRPSMEDVLWNLQYANQVQDARDGDQRYSSASQQ